MLFGVLFWARGVTTDGTACPSLYVLFVCCAALSWVVFTAVTRSLVGTFYAASTLSIELASSLVYEISMDTFLLFVLMINV